MTTPSHLFKILLNLQKKKRKKKQIDTQISRMHLCRKHGMFVPHLHSPTHPSHSSISERLRSTLTTRHRETRQRSEYVVVRAEGWVQGQDPQSPALPPRSAMRITGGRSNMLPSGFGGRCWCSRRFHKKVFQKKLCHMSACRVWEACLSFFWCKVKR